MKKIIVTEQNGKIWEYIEYNGEVLAQIHLLGHGSPERDELDENGIPTGNKIPADFSVEIFDLSQDHDFLLSECYKNRTAEYPSLADQMDAFFHARQGSDSQLNAIDEQIKAVKLKYPKPS